MDAHCAEHFSEAKQRAEIADPQRVTLLVESAPELIGYATLYAQSKPAAELSVGVSPVEIERFYIHRAHHGAGLAQLLMEQCHAHARALGGDVLWLGVWKDNPRAVAFYRKCGFEIIGEQIFMLGTEVQHDHVMARSVASG